MIICGARNTVLPSEAVMLCFREPSFRVSGFFFEPHTKPSIGQAERRDGIKHQQLAPRLSVG